MSRVLPVLALAVSASLILAEEPIPGITVDGSGQLKAANVTMSLIHYASGWRVAGQAAMKAASGSPSKQGDTWQLNATWATQAGAAFTVDERISKKDTHHLDYAVHLTNDPGIESNALAFSVSLPTDRFAGRVLHFGDKEVTLPLEITEGGIFDGNASLVRIPADAGLLTFANSSLVCHVQDDRQWGGNSYSVRFAIANGTIADAKFSVTIGYDAYTAHAIDLKSVANMGWADPTADDQQGGWTDQGPDNDLSAIKPGKQTLANVGFTLVDPATNAGKSALVLAGPHREYFPKEATITIPDAGDRHLYLLHASAWAPAAGTVLGNLHITYADGETVVQPITVGKDVGNWWAPSSLNNGVVGWTTENGSAYVGLYCSHVALTKAAQSVRIESTGTGVWMIAAMTSTPDAIPLPKEGPYYIIANNGWRAVKSTIEVEAGSILDFSNLLDAPAGKYGAVTVRDGHFGFAKDPAKRIRFYGTNFCFSANFPSHDEADAIAERMAQEGYNTVRLHHYDWDITAKDEKDSTILDPQQLDKFHYLIHALEKRGLYISIDLFTFRQVRPDEVPEVEKISRSGYKAAVAFIPSAMTNWEQFTHNLLTAPNPYTGVPLGKDPALAGICPVNEDTMWSVVNDDAGVLAIARAQFEAWLAIQKLDKVDSDKRDSLWTRFLGESQIAANRHMKAYLHSIDCIAPVTGVNFISTMNLVPTRADDSFDYVDNHAYWDHPGFPERPWSLPMSYQNRSAVAGGASVPRGLLSSRVIGKPYTITEFNYVFPNQFRAEGGPLIGAYAALQDWDGLWRFAQAHNLENLVSLHRTGGFDLGTDPLSRLSERLGLLCFLRGDVAVAKGQIALAVDDESAYAGKAGWGSSKFPDGFDYLGLHTAIGTVYGADHVPADPVVLAPERIAVPKGSTRIVPGKDLTAQLVAAGAVPDGAINVESKTVTSDTGEIALHGDDGRFQVVTPRSEHFVFTGAGNAEGKIVRVSNGDQPTTIGVAAMDDQPLANSARVLVVHLTNLANTRTRFRGKAMTLLESLGDLPHLVHAGKAEVRLNLAGEWTVWACDLSGHRVREVATTREGTALILACDQNQGEEPVLVYDLQRK